MMITRRYVLRDDQWERIKDMLSGKPGDVGVTAKDNRLFVDAVLYRYRAGIPWRDIPEHFGKFNVIHTRFSRWALSTKIHATCDALGNPTGFHLTAGQAHDLQGANRAIATRYDKTARSFLSAIHLAAVVIWLN